MSADGSTATILYVDDDLGTARLVQKNLRRLGYQVNLAHSCSEGMYLFREGDFDLALLDYHLPDGDGIALLKDLQKEDPSLPAIVLTGVGDERTAVEAMLGGASNYVIKDTAGGYVSVLPTVIENALNQKRLVAQQARHQEAMTKSKDQAEAACREKDALLSALSREQVYPLEYLANATEEGLLKGTTKGGNYIAQLLQNMKEVVRLMDQMQTDNVALETVLKNIVAPGNETVDLYAVLATVQQMVQRAASVRQIEIVRAGERKTAWVQADKLRLLRGLLNLLVGAMAVSEKGTISLEIKQERGYGVVEVRVENVGITTSEVTALCETVQGKFERLPVEDDHAFPLVLARQLTLLQLGDVEVTVSDGSEIKLSLRLQSAAEPADSVRDSSAEAAKGATVTPPKPNGRVERSLQMD